MTKARRHLSLEGPSQEVTLHSETPLESTNFWPEKRTVATKITNWIMLAICVFIECGQVAFVAVNIKDITKIASAMSTVSTTFQVSL
jgi:hypothetical protein